MPRKKLYPGAVAVIRSSSESVSALARRFGVDRHTIRDVRSGKSWKGAPSKGVDRG